MSYKEGDTFWMAKSSGGVLEIESVTVTKVTKLYYYISPYELLFDCRPRINKYKYDGSEFQYHTTKKEALFALLDSKREVAKKAHKDIKTIESAITEAGKE